MVLTRERTAKLLILILIGFIGGCSYQLRDPQSVSNPNQVAKDQPKSVKSQEPNAPATYLSNDQKDFNPDKPPQIIREFDLEEVSAFVRKDDPIVMIDVQVIKERGTQRALRVEFENVSSKPASLIGFHLSYPHCLEFLYAGSLWLSYGDPKLVNPKDQTPIDPILNPGQKTIKIFKAKEVSKLLNPNTFHRCPPGKRTPVFVLVKVHFNDGTVWDPIGDLVEKIRSQSIQTKRP